MTIVLRIIAIIIGIAVTLTGVSVVQFAARGGLGVLIESGAVGLITIAAWLIILTAGPVATIQLCRLRRVGLFAAAMLCGLAFTYYVIGLFLRTPEAALTPIVEAIVGNGVVLALLLAPAARRGVS